MMIDDDGDWWWWLMRVIDEGGWLIRDMPSDSCCQLTSLADSPCHRSPSYHCPPFSYLCTLTCHSFRPAHFSLPNCRQRRRPALHQGSSKSALHISSKSALNIGGLSKYMGLSMSHPSVALHVVTGLSTSYSPPRFIGRSSFCLLLTIPRTRLDDRFWVID